jgi:hypothetical protein
MSKLDKVMQYIESNKDMHNDSIFSMVRKQLDGDEDALDMWMDAIAEHDEYYKQCENEEV